MVRALAGCAAVFALVAACPGAARASQEDAGVIPVVAIFDATAGTVAPARAERGPLGAGGRMKPPAVTLTLEADLTTQLLTVKEGEHVLHAWPISSGRRGYATPTGTFRPAWMAKSWYSRKYDNAPMPHAVFFNDGIAFHGTSAVAMLGRPASHGCVRLAPGNAARLYALVHAHGLVHTKVIVHGLPKFEQPTVVARKGGASPARNAALARQRAAKGASPYGQPVAASQWFFFQ